MARWTVTDGGDGGEGRVCVLCWRLTREHDEGVRKSEARSRAVLVRCEVSSHATVVLRGAVEWCCGSVLQ